MIRFLCGIFWVVVFIAICVLMVSCDQARKRTEHDNLVKGCVLTETIQGYSTGIGRDDMPSKELWNCNGIMRTVNAI